MGLKNLFKGSSEKGMECNNNPDGSVTCKRIVRAKDGKLDFDGQEVTIGANPDDGCKPVLIGSSRMMDDEVGEFDKIAKKVTGGCHRQKGITQG